MKVLIVEDDPMVAELNQQFIERMDNLDVVCKADTVKKHRTVFKSGNRIRYYWTFIYLEKAD